MATGLNTRGCVPTVELDPIVRPDDGVVKEN
jgi:hypothetical protein